MKEVIKTIEEYEKRCKMLAHALVQDRKNISYALKEARLKKRISLREMAKRLGFSPAYLSDIESGKRGISLSLLEKLKKLK